MKIYAIEQDFAYYELDLRTTDIEDYFPERYEIEDILEFSRKNISLKEFWPSIKTGFMDTGENLKVPDISIWLDGVLLLSPAAKIYTNHFLEKSGEFLPIIVDDEEWFLFNCLTEAPVNKDLTNNSSVTFQAESFRGHDLFKSIANDMFGFYCTERFKALIDEYNLKGLSLATEQHDYLTGEVTTLSV